MASNNYTGFSHAPEAVQPGLEHVPNDRHEKTDPYLNSYGPEVAGASHAGYSSRKQQRNPFGLSPIMFGLLVGVVTAAIMGAALGGSLGGALSSCQSQRSKLKASPTATAAAASSGLSSASSFAATVSSTTAAALSTATLTNFAVTPIRSISTLALDCPNINNTQFKNHFNQNFQYTCDVDIGNQGSSLGGNINDLAAIIAYTIEDCIDACSAFNFQSLLQGRSAMCSSVSFFADVASVLVGNGNCWLKNGTLAAGVSGKSAENAVSAQLLS